jgi:small subunit ribosomal protein S20
LANIKSQIKRNRQNEKRRLQNRVYSGTARKAIRNTLVAIEAGEKEDAQSKAMIAMKALDKAAAKGVIHKNNAARRKSRLMKQINSME